MYLNFRLKKIPNNFIDLPVQAMCCELAGFFPPEHPTGKLYRNTKWPVETMKSLFQIVANKRLIACILVSALRLHPLWHVFICIYSLYQFDLTVQSRSMRDAK